MRRTAALLGAGRWMKAASTPQKGPAPEPELVVGRPSRAALSEAEQREGTDAFDVALAMTPTWCPRDYNLPRSLIDRLAVEAKAAIEREGEFKRKAIEAKARASEASRDGAPAGKKPKKKPKKKKKKSAEKKAEAEAEAVQGPAAAPESFVPPPAPALDAAQHQAYIGRVREGLLHSAPLLTLLLQHGRLSMRDFLAVIARTIAAPYPAAAAIAAEIRFYAKGPDGGGDAFSAGLELLQGVEGVEATEDAAAAARALVEVITEGLRGSGLLLEDWGPPASYRQVFAEGAPPSYPTAFFTAVYPESPATVAWMAQLHVTLLFHATNLGRTPLPILALRLERLAAALRLPPMPGLRATLKRTARMVAAGASTDYEQQRAEQAVRGEASESLQVKSDSLRHFFGDRLLAAARALTVFAPSSPLAHLWWRIAVAVPHHKETKVVPPSGGGDYRKDDVLQPALTAAVVPTCVAHAAAALVVPTPTCRMESLLQWYSVRPVVGSLADVLRRCRWPPYRGRRVNARPGAVRVPFVFPSWMRAAQADEPPPGTVFQSRVAVIWDQPVPRTWALPADTDTTAVVAAATADQTECIVAGTSISAVGAIFSVHETVAAGLPAPRPPKTLEWLRVMLRHASPAAFSAVVGPGSDLPARRQLSGRSLRRWRRRYRKMLRHEQGIAERRGEVDAALASLHLPSSVADLVPPTQLATPVPHNAPNGRHVRVPVVSAAALATSSGWSAVYGATFGTHLMVRYLLAAAHLHPAHLTVLPQRNSVAPPECWALLEPGPLLAAARMASAANPRRAAPSAHDPRPVCGTVSEKYVTECFDASAPSAATVGGAQDRCCCVVQCDGFRIAVALPRPRSSSAAGQV